MKRYRVTGIHPVFGYPPGATFTADLPPEQERALIRGGALRVERKKTPRKPARQGG